MTARGLEPLTPAETNPLPALLRRCVVHIEGDGEFRGTGFFVAPGEVLTCAHVVHGSKEITVVWDGEPPLSAVVERSLPDLGVGDPAAAFYPLPDVALLRLLDSPPEHPCVRFDATEPATGPPADMLRLDAVGVSEHTAGRVARSPATFEYEGALEEDGWRLLKLKGGQVIRGFSGGPVLNSRTGGVCAVVDSTRNERSDLGGFGVPLAAFLDDLPGLGERNQRHHQIDLRWEQALATEGRSPARCDVPKARDMVIRQDKLDEIVARLLSSASVSVTSLKGAGGVGKSVLAQQVGHDPRVRAAYPGGVWWLPVGEDPQLEPLAEALYGKVSGGRPPAAGISVVAQLGTVIGSAPMLVIFDDVWAPTDVADTLLNNLPATVHALVTTRGAELGGSLPVSVDELSATEARQILLGKHTVGAASNVLAQADELARVLGRWALLVAMAGKIVKPDLGGPVAAATAALESIATDFAADPTVLDDPASRERSFSRITQRGERSLSKHGSHGSHDLQRFWDLGVYPADTALEVELLSDLWACGHTEARGAAQRMAEAGLATVVTATDARARTLVLHDLIVDHLHRRHCRPGQFPDLHRRCTSPAIGLDGQPEDVTAARARWLVHHLVAAGDWSLLEHLASLRWRGVLLARTGSDASLFNALDSYASAALQRPNPIDATRHYFTAIVFAGHLRALIGVVPVAVLTTSAMLGNPVAALTQAAHRPDAGTVLPQVLAAIVQSDLSDDIISQAVVLAGTILHDGPRSGAFAAIAARAAASNPSLASQLLERAVELAGTIPDDQGRISALAEIAKQAATSNPALTTHLLERAVKLAWTIPEEKCSSALLAIVGRVAASDPADARWIERAVKLAATIPDDPGRSWALAEITMRVASADPAGATRIARAVELAGARFWDRDRSWALAAIAGWAAASNLSLATQLIERAVELAAIVPDDWERSWALTAIAEHMAASDPTDARRVERAVKLAGTIPDDGQRSEALAAIGERVAANDPRLAMQLLVQAVELAETMLEEGESSWAFTEIAERVAASDPADVRRVEWAVELAATIPEDHALRSQTLVNIAERVATSDPADVTRVERAVQLAGAIPDNGKRSEALAVIAERAAASNPSLATELLERAVELVGTVPDDGERIRAISHIVKAVAASDPADAGRVERAIELARTIPADEHRGGHPGPEDGQPWLHRRPAVPRSETLAAIAMLVATGDSLDARRLDRALGLVAVIPDERERAQALADIAQAAAAANAKVATEVLEQAVQSAVTIVVDERRSWALATIAALVASSDPGDTRRAEWAVELAGTIPDDYQRSWALAAIAERVTVSHPRLATELLERAVELAATIPDGPGRSWALAEITERVASSDPTDATRVEWAVELAGVISDEGQRSSALRAIVELVVSSDPADAKLVERAVELTARIADDQGRSRALKDIAERVVASDPADARRVGRAVELAWNIPDDRQRSETLAAIAASGAARNPSLATQLLERAVELAARIPDDQARSGALRDIGERVAASDPADVRRVEWAIELAGAIPDDYQRSWALEAVAQLVVVSDPADARRVERAVELAGAIPSNSVKGWAFKNIAARVVASDPADARRVEWAVELAGTIPDDDQRSETLATIAGMLGDPKIFASGLNWRAVGLGSLLEAIAKFEISALSNHPEAGLVGAEAVCRTAVAFRTDPVVG